MIPIDSYDIIDFLIRQRWRVCLKVKARRTDQIAMNTYRSVPPVLCTGTHFAQKEGKVHGKQKRDGQLHSTHSTVQFTHLPHLGESRRFRFDRFAFPGVGQTAFTSSTRRRLSFSSPPRHSPPAAGLLREVNPTRETLSLSLAPILTGLGAHGVFGVMPQRRDSSIPSSPAVSRCRVRLLGI